MCKSREKIISSESRFCELTKLIYWVQKFLIFSRINTTFTVSYPKGLTSHFIETKAIKHDYYSSLIMWTHKNSKDKYWDVSPQALFFNAFLARHDDDNDAHIKDKNWNITGASWSILLALFKSNPLPMHRDFVSKQLMGTIINLHRKVKQA